MRKLSILLTFALYTSCNISPPVGNISPPSDNITYDITINTDTRTQYKLKQKWLVNTTPIIRGSYEGRADLWGGGSLLLDLWFQDGNLWDAMLEVDNLPYVMHTLLNNEASFIDENTAIMAMSYSASPKLSGNLYVVRLSNDTIYRTESPSGFAHISKWNGKTVNTNNIIPIAQKK